MKKYNLTFLLCLFSFLPLSMYSQHTGNAQHDTVLEMNAENRATSNEQLYAAYKIFKEGKLEEVITILKQQAYEIQVAKTVNMVHSGVIDTLKFRKNDGSEILFARVDLGYVKMVNVLFNLTVQDAKQHMRQFENLLVQDGLILSNDLYISGVCAEFKSVGEHWMVESRMQNPSYTKLASLYYHAMSSYGDHQFSIKFNETIPEKWVTSEKVPTNLLGTVLAAGN